MALTGKLVGQVEIKCQARLLHDLYRHKPNDIAAMSGNKVQACLLVNGEWGAVGSVIEWHYTFDGKQKSTKEVIEAIDDENLKIVFKVTEGDLTELYNVLVITLHVESNDGKQLVTWTLEFEKANANVPDPTMVVDSLCSVVKDIDAHMQTI